MMLNLFKENECGLQGLRTQRTPPPYYYRNRITGIPDRGFCLENYIL
jgi:hypothetical protein